MGPQGETVAGNLLRAASLAQALYYTVTGFWPVLNMRTFELITGPKRERWLVKTAGLLIGMIGLTMAVARRHGREVEPEISLLAAGSALSLAGIDLVYWKRGRLRFVYLLDALAELALAGVWAAGFMWGRERADPDTR